MSTIRRTNDDKQIILQRRKQHRFVPGKCRSLTYSRPQIDRLLRQRVNIVYNVQDDYNRELWSRAVFVEEALRITIADNVANCTGAVGTNDDAVDCCDEVNNPGYEMTSGRFVRIANGDTTCSDNNNKNDVLYQPPHRCSDPRNFCTSVRSCGTNMLRRNLNRGYLLRCASLYFSFFYDIPRVYHVEPFEYDGGEHQRERINCSGTADGNSISSSSPFGAIFEPNNRELYICCNERIVEDGLLATESVPDYRLLVNDTSIFQRKCDTCTSSFDRRVFTILAFVANVERLVYDTLITVARERTLGELLFISDDDENEFEQKLRREKIDQCSTAAAITVISLNTNGGLLHSRLRDVDVPNCFL